MRKLLTSVSIFLILASLFLVGANLAFAQENALKIIPVYFFRGEGCPHCADEEAFLGKLKIKYPQIEVRDFEIWHNKNNFDLLKRVGKKLNVNISGIPFTVINSKYFQGYFDDASTGAQLEAAVKECLQENMCKDMLTNLVTTAIEPAKKPEIKGLLEKIKFPILGEVAIKNLSLPVLTIIFGALDGFNPCAMWTLVFLISLLLGMENRKRMWILGSAFIAASAAVYFLFMAAWLNLLLFLGFVLWVRTGIGLVALGGGFLNLKEYFTNPQGACKVTGGEKRRKIFDKLREITHRQEFMWALIGIILLAFAVNLVELICSAGLPAVYTQILTLSDLAKWQYYLYLLLYIFIFMLDDLFVFIAAMVTLQATGLTTKYTRISHLIGGIVMLIIGVLLIFKPGWLAFG